MNAVILCGGLGTRMREETEFRPKAMVEIGGRPILWHIMKIFAHHGIQEFVLCLGYKGSMIKEYFLNYDAMNRDVRLELGSRARLDYLGEHDEQRYAVKLIDTGASAQTGARLKRVERHVQGDQFMLTYGDGLADVDLGRLLAFHAQHGRLATVTTARVPGRFGVVESEPDGTVLRFREKPREDVWISAGYFVFERRVFDYVNGDDGCILEREPLERLAAERQLVAYRHPGDFFAMDTYRDYLALNELWSTNRAPWKVW